MSRRQALALLFTLAAASAGSAQDDESEVYRVEHFRTPEGAVLEVGGMDFLPDGRLALSTRRGQVWFVEGVLDDDPAAARFQLFAEGLHEGLGLKVSSGELFVVQRGELSRLIDEDGDDRCDRIETIANGWGLSGHYHEFAFGLPETPDGRFLVGLNVSFGDPKWWHGRSTVPYRGWLLSLGRDGSVEPLACGLRSPCGLGFGPGGELFITDNQGDWAASTPIYHYQKGGFYGHPASLRWTEEYRASDTIPSDTVPPARATTRNDAAVWVPYKWSRSAGNLVMDASEGRFGFCSGQMILAELTNGMLLRVDLEKVQGQYQGAVWPLRRRIGSIARVLQAPDGTLLCGLTNRGWGGLPPADGLARVRWTGVVPLEVREVRLLHKGFWLEFTKPLAQDLELTPANVRLEHYDYDYWWEYGSPERDTRRCTVDALHLSRDRRSLVVLTNDLEPARVARMVLDGVRAADGSQLLHPEFAYTIRQIPHADFNRETVAKIVPPPPGRESSEAGWLRLTYGDATDVWRYEGWKPVDATLDRDDPTRFRLRDGNGALVNVGFDAGGATHYTSDYEFGDGEYEINYMLPEAGHSRLWLQGRYAIELTAYRGPGLWHELKLSFRAPRFDAQGVKVENARIERLEVDEQLLHEKVELTGPSATAPLTTEAANGPLVVDGKLGRVAIGGLRVKPRQDGEAEHEEGWQALFAEDDELSDWSRSGDALWRVEDGVLIGEGPRGHLFTPAADYENLEVRARVKINGGGNSGLYVRASNSGEWPAGYEAQINSAFPDPQKSGSLYGLAPIKAHLIAPDTWFDYRVRCADEARGTRLSIWINGIQVVDYLDDQRRHTTGHIALQQHHEGSVVEVRDAFVRRW